MLGEHRRTTVSLFRVGTFPLRPRDGQVGNVQESASLPMSAAGRRLMSVDQEKIWSGDIRRGKMDTTAAEGTLLVARIYTSKT